MQQLTDERNLQQYRKNNMHLKTEQTESPKKQYSLLSHVCVLDQKRYGNKMHQKTAKLEYNKELKQFDLVCVPVQIEQPNLPRSGSLD